MTDIVLDTHACVFALSAPSKLGAAGTKALRQAEAGRCTAWVPAAVVAEIVMLKELDRISIGLPELRIAMSESGSFRLLPLDLKQLNEFAAHSGIRDPFDRLIISACRTVDGRLLTKDERIQDSGLVVTVW